MVDRADELDPDEGEFGDPEYFTGDYPEQAAIRSAVETVLMWTGRDWATHDDLLAAIFWLNEIKKLIDEEIAGLIEQALRLGWTWAVVAKELGITRQAAHKRFGSDVAGWREVLGP